MFGHFVRLRHGCAIGVIVVAAVVSAACTSAPTDPTQATSEAATAMSLPPAMSAELDKAIQDAMVAGSAPVAGPIPGAIVAIRTPEGRFVRAYGLADTADRLAMDPAMTTRIGSITKTFIVTAVLQLVDAGKLDLDDPIGEYLPGVPNGDKITIRHLAGMRSGLPDYVSNPEFRATYFTDPTANWQPDQLLAYAFDNPVLFEPGERFHYSNTNMILLGQLIENISGTTLSDYLDTRILSPVGLAKTALPNNATLPEPYVRGYQTTAGTTVETTAWNPFGWAAGGIVSTVDDLDRWIQTIADGSLLSAETQQARMDFQPTDDPTFGYGLGLIEHDGWIFHEGSMPGYQTFAGYHHDAGVVVVVAINTDATAYVQGKAVAPLDLIVEAVITTVTPETPFTVTPL